MGTITGGTMQVEVWKDIEGYGGVYQISNFGRIKSFSNRSKGKELALVRNPSGYMYIHLWINGKCRYFRVHRLLAKAFIPNPENKPEINHKNGIKDDNKVENLEWCTHKENMEHAFKIGLKSHIGEKHPCAKLKNSDVQEIRRLLKYGLKQCFIAKMFLSSDRIISHINTGSRWKRI